MNLEEYRKFIKERGFKEEEGAVEVVKEIYEYHKWGGYTVSYSDLEVYPRKVLNYENSRIEFDLLIVLKHDEDKRYDRKIGVEFKETDIDKVIQQAMVRRPFVDYMYIATRNIDIDYYHLIILSYLGIGWVVYFSDINRAKLVLKAYYNYDAVRLKNVIDAIIDRHVETRISNIEREVDEKLSKLDNWLKKMK